ncbi:MAG: zinc-binding dehydrogenase [Alicyclobacillus sp.]|nr:zinc-binding dehydrogenase [Alicyclobacillus sp.]
MQAVVLFGGQGLAGVHVTDVEEPQAGPGQVRVRLRAAGLNRRDLRTAWLSKSSDKPVILGSDGAGVVDQIGNGVPGQWLGAEVVINPSLHWLRESSAPPPDFEILGSPSDGTFAEWVVVPAAQIEPKPRHLSWREAGVLPLAALTAYRALFSRGRIQPGQTVLIPGGSSGVATFLIQFAKRAGARVCVTSRSAAKRALALQWGADVAIDTDSDWLAQLGGPVDLIVDGVGAAVFEQCLRSLRPGGTWVTFGATAGDTAAFNLRTFFYGQMNLLGSTMGSHEEFQKMLHWIEAHQIRPVLDQVYPLSAARTALERLQNSEQFGKIGLVISES